MVIVKRLIGQGATDSQGKVSVGYDSNHTGTINIKAESKGLEANTTITVRDDILLLTGTNKIIQTGDTTTLTAKLPPKPGTVIEDQTIYLSKNVDSTDWSLDLTASKEIIQVGETTTLTMLVKDSNDNAKENIVLNLYKVDDSMAKELVATLVTDSTGMASYNYVGVGAGLLGFIAESGRLLSGTYATWDCIAYDMGTLSNHNDAIWETTALSRFTRETDYTMISSTESNLACYMKGLASGHVVDFEIDISSMIDTGGTFLNIFENTNTSLIWFQANHLGLTVSEIQSGFLHMRLEIGETSATLTYVDNPVRTATREYTSTGTPNHIRFANNISSLPTIKIRNIKVYPI